MVLTYTYLIGLIISGYYTHSGYPITQRMKKNALTLGALLLTRNNCYLNMDK